MTSPKTDSSIASRAGAPGLDASGPAQATSERHSLAGESAAVPGLSPWECLEEARAEAAGEPLFLWEAPSGEAIAGIGAACTLESGGFGRFADIRARLERLLGGAKHPGAPPAGFPGAVAVGGFAFAEQIARRGWPGFADASFHVPARIFWQAPGGTTIETRWSANGNGVEPQGGLREDPTEPAGGPDLEAAPEEIGERDRWLDAVRLTLDRIREGTFSKAVLARSRGIELDRSADAAAIMASLRAAYPTCYRFLIGDRNGNAFLGASPERLVRLVGDEVLTEAVAGTQRCEPEDDGSKLARALAKSEKDLSEHRIVLDHLLAALSPLCESLHAAASPEVMRLPHLLHLRTSVRGSAFPGAHVLELVSRLHPTPAVAGWPRSEALSWIARVEAGGRGWYAGPVGWVNARGEGDFAVGIRSIGIRGRSARLFAGAGIVAGSDPALEWSETELKMKGILDAVARD